MVINWEINIRARLNLLREARVRRTLSPRRVLSSGYKLSIPSASRRGTYPSPLTDIYKYRLQEMTEIRTSFHLLQFLVKRNAPGMGFFNTLLEFYWRIRFYSMLI